MASNKKGSEGTILLRQAEPRYKFVGKKLPKTSEPGQQNTSGEGAISVVTGMVTEEPVSPTLRSQSIATTMGQSKSFSVLNNMSTPQGGKKPVAVVGASYQTKSPSVDASRSTCPHGSVMVSDFYNGQQATKMNLTTSQMVAKNGVSAMSVPLPSSILYPSTQCVDSSEETEKVMAVVDSSAADVALSNVTSVLLSERLQEVERERDCLKKDLDAQLEVNGELKRLLIASVGDDLSRRVERLAQDRVQLSIDIGGFNKKMTEDYENLDKMSIEADMWRSKYLASRVMVEELGNARAYFSLQWHESQEALQQMLTERYELRANLLEAYKILQQVKDAFDPLNSHHSSSLPSTNVLDLSRSCQKLGEAVRFRLLPAHIATASSVEIDMDSWENSVTRAEKYAHELLSRPSEPVGSLQSGAASTVLPVTKSSTLPRVNRFHPQVKHDNVTIQCCHKCKGDIFVL